MLLALKIGHMLNIDYAYDDMVLDCVNVKNETNPIEIRVRKGPSYRYIRVNVEPGVEFIFNNGDILREDVNILWLNGWHILRDDLTFITQTPPVDIRDEIIIVVKHKLRFDKNFSEVK